MIFKEHYSIIRDGKPVENWSFDSVSSFLEVDKEFFDNFHEVIQIPAIYNEYERTELKIILLENVVALMEAYFDLNGEKLPEVYKEYMGNPSPSPKENKKYYTYIAKDLKNKNLYKIGATSDLDGREKSLRVSNPFIDIIASKQTEKDFNFKLEAALHKYLKDYNVKGEWFELNQDQVDEIIDLFEFTSCMEHEEC